MSAVSKNFVISFFVRSVVPVVAETMLKTAGLIHQNVYEEIFKFTECRHGTRNLVVSSAGKKKWSKPKFGPFEHRRCYL